MNDLDILRLAGEAESYPAVLAWLEYAQTAGVAVDLGYLTTYLDESPWEGGECAQDLFERYVEVGETGAALALTRRYIDLSADQVLRRKSQLVQQLAEARLSARDALVQIQEANQDLGTLYNNRLDSIEGDPILSSFRPGLVLESLETFTRELRELAERERERVLQEARALRVAALGNGDVELAVKRIEDIIALPEGLATAASMLAIARRANAGGMSQDDIRLLYSSSNDNQRLVRPWETIRSLVADANGPAALAERLSEEALAGTLRLPSNFDRDRLQELLLSLVEHDGSINTKNVANQLGGFLDLRFEHAEEHRGRYGSSFPFKINLARHKDFRGNERQLYLSVPLRGTNPSAFGQLYRALSESKGPKPLPILLYPGIADPSKPFAHQLGITDAELLFLDCIDLLRIAEVPKARRIVALQQVLLPRMPSVAKRTYQTGGPVTSELFRGREEVIDNLTSPRGKTVLFSGRMMGKSSVLSRIRDQIESSPESHHSCVLLSAASGELLDPLMDKLLPFLPLAQKREIVRQREYLKQSPQDPPKIQHDKERDRVQLLRKVIELTCDSRRLTLLIDEADTFAKNDARKDRELSLAWLLRDVENHAADKLRVVFAGFQTLHHEVIAANGAFANWFGQWQLGPLDRNEAISLIKEPLADFGVQFASDAGVERILEFSGRYPLLIQEVCARLMERAMARRNLPIKPGEEVTILRAGEVELVCRDETLRNRLHQVLSLNLDGYPRLKLVTYLTLQAGLYRPAGEGDRFRIEDVQQMLVDWYGDKLSEHFSETSLPGLVEELESLGLIARQGDDGYRFINRTFVGMLRDNRNFENELLNLLEQVASPIQTEPRRYLSLPKEHLDALLRSRCHTLILGLPGTLKSEIAQTLFRSAESSAEIGSVLLTGNDLDGIDAVQAKLQRQLRETRRSLSLGDLCVKYKIRTLVLDCPTLAAPVLKAIAQELSGRADIRLIATADVAVARAFVFDPRPDFELIPLRRLRTQDIQAWGEKPYVGDRGKEFSLVIDQKTANSLMRVTCGYFPLLQQFRDYCHSHMPRGVELYPSEQHVDGFRKRLTSQKVHETLLGQLKKIELDTLHLLLNEAIDTTPPQIERDWAQDLILDRVQDDESELNDRLNALELCLLIDLITEKQGWLVFDNHALLKRAFEV